MMPQAESYSEAVDIQTADVVYTSHLLCFHVRLNYLGANPNVGGSTALISLNRVGI